MLGFTLWALGTGQASSCADKNEHCANWAANGECERNPSFMKEDCVRSCGQCRCSDRLPNCADMAAVGACDDNLAHMQQLCSKSCKAPGCMEHGPRDNAETLILFQSLTTAGHWRQAWLEHSEQGLLTHVGGSQELVMASDESDYMARLAEVATRAGGRVLEVGFGMGISARALARHGAKQHIVLEPNIGRYAAAIDHATEHAISCAVFPMLGYWEELVPLLRDGSFDAILFDPFPAVVGPAFMRSARRLLKPGGVLTFYWAACNAQNHRHDGLLEECVSFDAAKAQLARAGWTDSEVRAVSQEIMTTQVLENCPKFPHCKRRPYEFVVPVVTKLSDDVLAAGRQDSQPVPVTVATTGLTTGAGKSGHDMLHGSQDSHETCETSSDRTISFRRPTDTVPDMALNDLLQAMHSPDGSSWPGKLPDWQQHAWYGIVAAINRIVGAKRVLHFGIGVGNIAALAAAAAVQQRGVQTIIIEMDALVMQGLLRTPAFAASEGGAFAPLMGSWEEVAPLMASASFDAILVAQMPLVSVDDCNQRAPHWRSLILEARRLLRSGGLLAIAGATSATAGGDANTKGGYDRTAVTAAALDAGFTHHHPMVSDPDDGIGSISNRVVVFVLSARGTGSPDEN